MKYYNIHLIDIPKTFNYEGGVMSWSWSYGSCISNKSVQSVPIIIKVVGSNTIIPNPSNYANNCKLT